MELENYVILDGLLSVIKEERLIVVLLITPLHKFYKEFNTTWQLTFGV